MSSSRLILSACFVICLTGCASESIDGRETNSEYRERRSVEAEKKGFDPAYFRRVESRHMAISFDIVEGKIQASSRPAEIRPGLMPRRSESGSVAIAFEDATGKLLGSYGVEDPLLARSCDFDDGPGELAPIMSGRIEVLVPLNENVHQIRFSAFGKQPLVFDVAENVKRRRPPDPRGED